MNTVKTEKVFFGLFLGLAAVCLALAAGLFISTGCKKHDTVYYTVTFDANGGTEIEAKEVESGVAVAKPDDPIRSGYVFDGWVKLDKTPYNFADAVTGNITLYATWKADTATPAVTYTVTFTVDGEKYKTLTAESGGTVSKPDDPAKDGATFVKWITAAGTEFVFTDKIESDITLYAVFKTGTTEPDPGPNPPEADKKFTVTFDADGGTAVVGSALVAGGAKVPVPDVPTKAGYEFECWLKPDGTEYDFNTPVTADITLKAKWGPEHFTITFDSNGGSEVTSQRQAKGEKVSVPAAPTKADSTFLGWFTADGTEYDFDTPVTADITLTAKWSGGSTGPAPSEPVAKPHNFTYNYSAIANPPADKAKLTQANFTGGNSFLKIAENKVTYRNKTASADGKSPDCIENKDDGISVTFTGTGTITISFAATGTKNTSSLELRNASGTALTATDKGSSVTEKNGSYEIYGTTADSVTFTITEAGTYTIYCRYEYTDEKGATQTRGARITGITMVDNYVDEK